MSSKITPYLATLLSHRIYERFHEKYRSVAKKCRLPLNTENMIKNIFDSILQLNLFLFFSLDSTNIFQPHRHKNQTIYRKTIYFYCLFLKHLLID